MSGTSFGFVDRRLLGQSSFELRNGLDQKMEFAVAALGA
jgi:hypothetical protein